MPIANWHYLSAWMQQRALPAAPGQPLRAVFGCSTGHRRTQRRHPITLLPDWHVQTPHDLAAERIAVAMGGRHSCVELSDRVIPALREFVVYATRAKPVPLRRTGDLSRWHAGQRQSCCPRAGFAAADDAAAHARSLRHVAAVRGAEPRRLQALVAARDRSWRGAPRPEGPPLADARRAAGSCSEGREAIEWLWACGVHPRWVLAIDDELAVGQRLPADVYLGVVVSHPDLAALRRSLGSSRGAHQASGSGGIGFPR